MKQLALAVVVILFVCMPTQARGDREWGEKFVIHSPTEGDVFALGETITVEWTRGDDDWYVDVTLIDVDAWAVAGRLVSGVPNYVEGAPLSPDDPGRALRSVEVTLPTNHPRQGTPTRRYQIYIQENSALPLTWAYSQTFLVTTSDSDGDGFTDDWERNGYLDKDGVYVPLPDADPYRKDVYVEVDVMEGFQPSEDALNAVVAAFDAAPTPDLPGIHPGISLHIVVDEVIPHVPTLGEIADTEYFWSPSVTGATNFDDLKSMTPGAEHVWHYCIWADHLPLLDGRSYTGMSRGAPSSDFVVAAGALTGLTDASEQPWWPQAGTFMHELGHNLGLLHGGSDDTNYKPNYLSVMNYAFQAKGLMVDGARGHFDYSCWALDALDESRDPETGLSRLDETRGLTPAAYVSGHGTTWWRSETWGPYKYYVQRWVDDASGPINWSGDDAGPPDSINRDDESELLTSHDDWAHLVFDGGEVGSGYPVDLPDATGVESLDRDTILGFAQPLGVAALKGHVSRKMLHLTWKPVKTRAHVVAYRIYRDGVPLGTSSTTEYKDRTVVPRQTYKYWVTWVNEVGQESVRSNVVELASR